MFWWLPGPVLDPWTEGKPSFLAAGFGLNDGWASKNALKGLQKVFLRKKNENSCFGDSKLMIKLLKY